MMKTTEVEKGSMARIAAACGIIAALALGAAAPGASYAEKGKETPAKPKEASMQKAKEAAGSVNAFAVDLYRELGKEEGNLFFSPTSISTALVMTYAGARGGTAEQMKKTLRLELEGDALHESFGQLQKSLAFKKKGTVLSVANALWGQKGLAFLKEFLGLTKKRYGAGLTPLDFKGAPGKAVKAINQWARKNTAKKIKEIVTEQHITPDTRLVLTNAVYFNGLWESRFDKKDTKDEDFYLTKAKTIKVPMMSLGGKTFRYRKDVGVAMIELPYKGGRFSMIIILPDAIEGLKDLEASLTAGKIGSWIESMKEVKVSSVRLPRFRMEDGFELSKPLSKLGMTSAFLPSEADFSGITGGKDLCISAVLHKSFVDVTEKGTEAAAVTAVVMVVTGASPPMLNFHADHPFLFLIRDMQTDAILFMGRLASPV